MLPLCLLLEVFRICGVKSGIQTGAVATFILLCLVEHLPALDTNRQVELCPSGLERSESPDLPGYNVF